MLTQAEFLDLARDALSHLYDYPYLETHPLALGYWPKAGGGPNRAQRLHRLLLESIEALHPPTELSQDRSRAQYYLLLVYRYVEGWEPSAIMRELSYSRRQFFREQGKALKMLAALLWEKLPQPPPSAAESGDLLAAEAERVLVQRETVDPSEVIQGVLDVIGGLAAQHSVILQCELDRRLPAIHGNRTLLRQVLLKALSDSVTQPGTRRVCLRMHDERRRVVVELAAEQSKPDRQGAPALDAACRLVEVIGGVWQGFEVNSTGWTCRFDFPSDTQKVLLAVEDNEAVIEAFRRYLAGYDYQVVGATTGGEALRLAHELNPAVITLDIMMPAQDGWEILQALKNDPATRLIPVIICSVLDDPELAHSLGAVAYLRKPVAQADLLSALASLPGHL